MEIALTTVIVISTVLLSAKGIETYRNYLAEMQLKAAANTVVADIIYLQQKNLFNGEKRPYSLDAEEWGYIIRSNKVFLKKVTFAQINCSKVYFAQGSTSITFSNNGTPRGKCYLDLRHRSLQKFYYRINVEPVTGRVVVHEK